MEIKSTKEIELKAGNVLLWKSSTTKNKIICVITENRANKIICATLYDSRNFNPFKSHVVHFATNYSFRSDLTLFCVAEDTNEKLDELFENWLALHNL